MNKTLQWQRVLARDPSFDGRFVYAVRSTGIYCRPSCPSRKPRREHVQFFPTPAEAEAAGFRACRRCAPRGAGLNGVAALADRVRAFIEEHAEEKLTLEDLARATGSSAFHLQRVFKRATGMSPREYAAALRLGRFKQDVRRVRNVAHALHAAGYGSSSRLYEQATGGLGMTPGFYLAGGPGLVITYDFARCSLGWLLVAATPRGICAVKMGNDAAALERDLRQEFPRAVLHREAEKLAPWMAAVAGEIARGPGRAALELPLDVRATAFQLRVWQALRRIPRGETLSYGELARSIGRPRAVRAVARACATNPVAVLVPCHRVVGRDGSLTGYRWGKERKRALIESERAAQGVRAG